MATTAFSDQFSILEHKVRLHSLVREGCLDDRVVQLLLRDGEPLPFERELWDYKLQQPTHTRGQDLAKIDKSAIDKEWANLAKDVIAFYNSYGGYILFGIADSPRKIVGFKGEFDVDELNHRVFGFSRVHIGCSFRVLASPDQTESIGILLVPQRPDSQPITLTRKDGPIDHSKPLFLKGTVFLRKGDSCAKADEPEDFEFLVSAGRRALSFATAQPLSTPTLNNNLPPRDASFLSFVGREDDTVALWNWFLDEFSPLKLVAGLGGVGKTTLVREFTEQVARTSPSGIEKVVWLSAKEAVYTAIQGKFRLASRVDFTDVDSLLRAVLVELGELDSNLGAAEDCEDLQELLVNSLTHIPAFLVVDDLDSLPLDLQQEGFHALLQCCTRAAAKAGKASKCVITARLDLGASPSQLHRVPGLKLPDFSQYVFEQAASIDLTLNFGAESQLMKRFHAVTDGSPTFAAAVLRLVSLGDQIEAALTRWKGNDGEEVRNFAFERELNNLTDFHIRALYAASILGECYLDELAVILNSNEAMLRDAVAELRKYHLISSGSARAEGISLVVPSSLQLMRGILRKKIPDPKRIDDECARLRSQSANRSLAAARITGRVVALWQSDEAGLALDVAKQGVRENTQVGDLHCLLGRAHLRTTPPDYKRAEISFREAYTLECKRPELIQLWIEAKYGLGDWKGILDITKPRMDRSPSNELYFHRATAYRELGKSSLAASDHKSAAEWFRAGGTELNDAFSKGFAAGTVLEFKELRADFMSQYVASVDSIARAADEQIQVWLAVCDSYDVFVRRPVLLRLGFTRLKSWWEAVTRRGGFDQRALNLVELQLKKANEIIETQKQYDGIAGPDLTHFLTDCVNDIANRSFDYGRGG
jgi:hypothetical protein